MTEQRGHSNGGEASPVPANDPERTGDTRGHSSQRPARISRSIARELRLQIQRGRLAPGDRLPPESELAKRFGAGRWSVREALRDLEARGLIASKVGGRGGTFVTAPTLEWASHRAEDILNFSIVTPRQFSEARRILEMSVVTLVCERADEQDIAELLRICDRGDVLAKRGSAFPLSLSAEFHTRVAAATHNVGLGIAARYLHGSMLMAVRAARLDAGRVGVAGNDDHRQFVAAVGDRDTAAAESIMRRHLSRAEEQYGRLPQDTRPAREW